MLVELAERLPVALLSHSKTLNQTECPIILKLIEGAVGVGASHSSRVIVLLNTPGKIVNFPLPEGVVRIAPYSFPVFLSQSGNLHKYIRVDPIVKTRKWGELRCGWPFSSREK
jgi:hypothetical protein